MTEPVDILVVDDLAAQRLAIEATLAELGERVISVGSGAEALKYLLDHSVAVIVLDVNMPEMDGFETAALIRKRPSTANTPIIFITADTDELLAARGYALGAVDYLFRPFTPEVLRTKVSVFVSLSRMQERVRREAEQQIELSREQAARAAAEDQSRRLKFLAEATGVLTHSLEGPGLVEELSLLFVPLLADVSGVVLAGSGRDAESAWTHAEEPRAVAHQPSPIARQLLWDTVLRVLSRGTPETITADGGAIVGIVLPIVVRGEIHGALAAAMLHSGRSYQPADLHLVQDVASRAAIALENRRLYQELHERDRRKDEFLAMLSHELRNPLGAITTAVRLLELIGSQDRQAARARDVIARQSAHLARMVDDLLDVSRLTAGRIALKRGPVVLREVVDRAVEALRASGRLDAHELSVTGNGTMVMADAARMEQVVTNLLVNAVKYTDGGGRIDVRVVADGKEALISVTDSGIGISPELLPHLFDVFVQGGQALDRAEGGLGIGLTLVRKLVELQGGSVRAFSDGVGCGSTFVVRLPSAEIQEPGPAESPPPPPLTQPLRILLVEDNEDVRETLRTLLEIKGHVVHEAGSGPDAVELAIEAEPHAALVDLGLPGFDGLEVAQRLRKHPATRGMLLVALTGYGQIEDRRRTLLAGFDAHLVKPVSPERLSEVLAMAARPNVPELSVDRP